MPYSTIFLINERRVKKARVSSILVYKTIIMSNETKSIHEFDIQLICEYFSSLERQGPGSEEATIKALSFIDNLTDQSQILDLGCGSGGQTMVIAENAPGTIFGMDLFPLFINALNANASKRGFQNRAKGILGSMDNIPFDKESFDLIWSEGAIYNIGYKQGLTYWNQFIKKGGYVAVSEATWLTLNRPSEIEEFWNSAYPGIADIGQKTKEMLECGFTPVASFVLPERCWTENFYHPQKKAQKIFLEKYADSPTAHELVANEIKEAEYYQRYKEYYGYVFYIGKKI